MELFTYEVWGIPTAGFFDPLEMFVTSHFVSPLVLACIRAVLCVYNFTTIIVSYTWLANNTATVGLKDVNIVHGLNSVFAIVEIMLPATEAPPLPHLTVVLLILSVYLGLAYLTRYTQGFYVYEWLDPAHGNVNIILHVLGYAGMIAIFFLVSGAIRLRNMLARRLSERKDTSIREKGMKLDDTSDTWSSNISIKRPEPVRRKDKFVV